MGFIFLIIGIILSFISIATLIKKIILNKGFVIKKVKVIGFEAYTYLTPEIDYNTIYNTQVYPIIEIKNGNEVVKIAISLFEDKSNLKKGDEIEIIYPKGKIEKVKMYNNNDIYNFCYMAFIIGVLITILSGTII